MTQVSTAPLIKEFKLMQDGYQYIIGIDEAGRGAIAGPVHVGYAIIPTPYYIWQENRALFPDGKSVETKTFEAWLEHVFQGTRDSKLFKTTSTASAHEKRMAQLGKIKPVLFDGGAVSCSSQEIDEMGIDAAIAMLVQRATDRALDKVRQFIGSNPIYEGYRQLPYQGNTFLLLDGGLQHPHFPYETIEKGEQHSVSIAAASLFAKTERDKFMMEVDAEYPEYGFADHFGYYAYGKPHMDVVRTKGATPYHRRSYKPISEWLAAGTLKTVD